MTIFCEFCADLGVKTIPKDWYICGLLVYFQSQKCVKMAHLAHCDVAHLAHHHPVFGIFSRLYQ